MIQFHVPSSALMVSSPVMLIGNAESAELRTAWCVLQRQTVGHACQDSSKEERNVFSLALLASTLAETSSNTTNVRTVLHHV